MSCLLYLLLFIAGSYCDMKDGGKAYRLPLNDGNSIPAIGLGTFLGFDEGRHAINTNGIFIEVGTMIQGCSGTDLRRVILQNGVKEIKEHEVENVVTWALNSGYRMIDTAAAYKNEDQVGDGVRASSLPRENVFVVTKLATNEQRDVVGSLKKSLERLNMSYVDLYLIHSPITDKPDFSGYDDIDYLDTWRGMEQAKKLGLAKSIGVSNFNTSQIERILANCEIKPSVLQVEVNLNLAQEKVLEFCKKHDMIVMAYTPFGSLFSSGTELPAPRADDPTLVDMAKKYKKTTPQIVLRYLIQRGVVPIPKSVNKNRIEENIDIFDFELTTEEMETLGKFNKNFRTVNISFWQDHPYYPYERQEVPVPSPFLPKKAEKKEMNQHTDLSKIVTDQE